MRLFFLFGGILFAVFSSKACALDIWLFNGHCKNGVIKQGPANSDLQNIRGSPVTCDMASIMEMNNGRKLVQFVIKQGKTLPPGFSGNEYKYTGANYSLIVDRIHPPRPLGGQSGADATNVKPAEGFCFFSNSDLSKLTDFSCVAKSEDQRSKFVYQISFDVADITVKRNIPGSAENAPVSPPVTPPSKQGSFDRIFEYTLFNEVLPDGKHPVWMYFQSDKEVIRVNMPSMDICVVTPQSIADMGVINSKNYDVIPKGTEGWDFAVQIWQAAFQRWLIVGQPKPC